MGYIGVITHLLTIDPNFQRDIQVEERQKNTKDRWITNPDAPCVEYLPTFHLIFLANVGKYSIHGAYG